MSDAPRAYRLVAADGGEEWFDGLAAAHAAIAPRLGAAPGELETLRRALSPDPVVVRRDDGRWRSAHVWMYRSPAGAVRLFEMIRVDEAQYDHDH
jgi:hypothetical protein